MVKKTLLRDVERERGVGSTLHSPQTCLKNGLCKSKGRRLTALFGLLVASTDVLGNLVWGKTWDSWLMCQCHETLLGERKKLCHFNLRASVTQGTLN